MYGLLEGCSHIFCVPCIRRWRLNQGKPEETVASGVTKQCPLCRAPSRFITPSSSFYPAEHPKKAEIIEHYKASMSRVPCKCVLRQSLAAVAFSYIAVGTSRNRLLTTDSVRSAGIASTSIATMMGPLTSLLMELNTICG